MIAAGSRRLPGRLGPRAPLVLAICVSLCESPARADIVISGDDWDKHVRLGAKSGILPPAIVTTADGRKSFHMNRPDGEKFAIYLLRVSQLPAGRTRFPVRLVARQVQDNSTGLGVRNLSIDPDDPDSDDAIQVQSSFVSILLTDTMDTGPRARDDRNLTDDADLPNSLGGLSGPRVEAATVSTVTNRTGELTTFNATLQLLPGLNVLRLDPTDPRDLPEYDTDPGYQIFSLTIGPDEPDLQGGVLGGITIRGDDWDKFAQLGAEAGIALPRVITTDDGHQSFYMTRPSGDKFGIYALNVTRLPVGKTRFPVTLLARQVRDRTTGLGIRNMSIDPDDPNSDPTGQVQASFLSIYLSDDPALAPLARDDLGGEDPENTLGLSGSLVVDHRLSPLSSPAGELTTANATLELRPGINLLRLDPTDPRRLPAYDPSAGYQLFLMTIGPDEPALEGEAVQVCSVTRSFLPNPYFPGDVVRVGLTASYLLGPITITDTLPPGWTVVDPGGGAIAGNTITFTVNSDGESAYTVLAPSCTGVNFSGATAGPYCRGTVQGDTRKLRCGIQSSGGISGMLVIGPVDIGNAGPQCDDGGRFSTTDYLAGGATSETNLAVALGEELQPSFGAAGGLGVKAAPNTALNPERAQGVLTVWRADADTNGRINFQDADNIGVLEHYVVYGLVYLENTTGACLDAILEVSANDALKVRLNGRLIYSRPSCETLAAPGQGEMVPVTLAQGRNVVLIGVVDATGGSELRLMVRDPAGAPLTGGQLDVSFTPPAAYPGTPATAIRTLKPIVARPGDPVTVTLAAREVSGPTTISDSFPAGWEVTASGGGAVNGETITFTRNASGDSSYTLTVPAPFSGLAGFSGVVSSSAGCGAIRGDSEVVVVVRDFPCSPEPGAPVPELIKAFAFGSRLLYCPTFNAPETSYTIVHHSANDAAAAAALAYNASRGWGYEVLYPDPASQPFGPRSGFGKFGPFDDSKHERREFPDRCPEQIYDSSIGMTEFPQTCDEAVVGNRVDPCTEETVLPGGGPYVPVGGIFRVDVPNGTYRFVAAVGDADNPHAHRILAEDGGSGPPEDIGPNHVALVKSFDQSQYGIGETDTVEPGKGVFARVGFNCLIPPPGDGATPSPRFVNMDADGEATAGPPDSPVLAVTQGYLRIHQLQANSNPGAGSLDNDPSGGDLVVLELWRIPPRPCPGAGDTHCTGLILSGPGDRTPGRYTATAGATDDARDRPSEEVRYTFRAQNGVDPPQVVGPQTANTATFDLTPGAWTVSVTVDDDSLCSDLAADASCSRAITVVPAAGGQIPLDCNQDGSLDISDGICVLFILFGGGSTPPCGDGSLESTGSRDLLDMNGDAGVNLSDAIGVFSYLFTNGARPVLGVQCRKITGCREVCAP